MKPIVLLAGVFILVGSYCGAQDGGSKPQGTTASKPANASKPTNIDPKDKH